MSDAGKAVFLSYASQDTEAAKRICESLRQAGVEVWFDQSELRGGDAWDQNIRRQIKECVLFVPIVSAATQARREGYFRLEWKLADDRTHLMAKGTPFLLPVCVDDTKDWDALVPDSFMSVQWTRLPGGETPPKFCERVKALLAGDVAPVSDRRSGAGVTNSAGQRPALPQAPTRAPARAWLLVAAIAVAAAVALAIWQPWQKPTAATSPAPAPAPAAAAPAAPAVSEGVKLAQRARVLYDKVGFTRDDMMLADDFAKRATDAEPTSAFCWGVRAHVQAAFLFRGFAVGDEFVLRSRDAQSFANRALSLQPDEPEALLALGRVATYQRAYAQAEEIFGRALAAHPADNRIRRALGTMLRYQPKRVPEALTVFQEAVRRDPRDPLAHYDLSMTYREARDFPAAWQEIETTIALQPFGSAFTQKASLALAWKGDVAAMRAALDQMSSADRSEDRAIYYLMWCGLIERRPERVLAAAALNSRDYLEDSSYAGPKAWFPALALQFAGQENSALLQWQAAERTLRERLRTDPQNSIYRQQLATTLAWMGRTEEAARELAPVEAAWREQMNGFRARSLARYYAGLGDAAKATAYLRRTVNADTFFSIRVMRIDPWWDKLRGNPEFEALLASPPPELAPIQPAPYAGKAPTAPTPAAREAEQLIAQVYALIGKVSYTRENLAVAENLTRQATDLAPDSARAWAARARVHASFVQRTWDSSDKRLQDTQAFATRALALDPDNADAMLAQAILTNRQGSPAQSEALLRRALELRPADALTRRLLANSLWTQGRNAESLVMSRETVRLFPDDALAHYDLGNGYTNSATRDPDLALKCFDAALAIEPFGSAILAKVLVLVGAKGDLAAARRALEQLAPTDRNEDRAVSFAMWIGMLERNVARVESAAALTARPYFEDLYFYGPKAWMLALAYQDAGREALARLQWQAAESAMRARLQANPGDLRDKFRLAVTLAWLGRTAEIAADAATLESVARESNNPFVQLLAAQYYAGLGDAPRAVPFLRKVLNFRDVITDRTLPLDPWWLKLRGTPEFAALLAEARARVESAKK
jgi:predicted Zn-dependent protease